MALNFPDSPTNGQKYTDPVAGETWTYESATNSWTSDGLTTAVGIQYKGGIDITATPPAGVANGWQYTVTTGGTANAGFTGLSGNIPAGTTILYDGANWQQAGVGVKWDRTGTALKPVNTGDTVQISAGTAALPGLTPVGDPNTGAWAPAVDTVAVSTNGAERLRVTADGRLGLGTPTPAAPLHVMAGSSASGALIQRWGYVQADISNYYLTLNTEVDPGTLAYKFSMRNNGTDYDDVLVFDRGNVGVGTPTPAAPLHVMARSSASGTLIQRWGYIQSDVDNYYLSLKSDVTPGILKYAFSMRNNGTDYDNVLVFDRGRVGIGNESPSHTLAVASTADADLFSIKSTASANNTSFLFGISGNDSIINASGGSSGRLAFQTLGSERARIDEVGHLLVGTSSAVAGSAANLQCNTTANLAGVGVYADNTAALAGGLVAGDIYRKSDGTLMIAF